MERKFEEELEDLKQQLLAIGAKVEKNIGDAIQALMRRDLELAQEVIRRDPFIDVCEIRVDELCVSVLARRQPVARDLRFIATALKIVKDLERIGDMATDISKHALALAQRPPLRALPDLPVMSRSAQQMLKRVLDAFVNRDADLARQVVEEDDVVDELHSKVWAELGAAMRKDAKTVDQLLHLFLVAKYLERIGDHSSNIAEMVVFMVEGKDIRHFEKIKGISGEEQ